MIISAEQATRVVQLLNDAIRVVVNAKFRSHGFIVMPDREIVFFGGGTEDCHIPSELRPAMITRIKMMAGMDILVHDKLQVGRIALEMPEVGVDLIVQTRPTRFGEEVMVRVSEEAHEPHNDTPVSPPTKAA